MLEAILEDCQNCLSNRRTNHCAESCVSHAFQRFTFSFNRTLLIKIKYNEMLFLVFYIA